MKPLFCKPFYLLPIAIVVVAACASHGAQAGEPAVVVPSAAVLTTTTEVTDATGASSSTSEPGDEGATEADATPLVAEPPTEVDAVFHEGRGAVEYCRKRVARDYGRQQGRLKLSVSIGTGGRVTAISVLENEATDKMAECMGAVIESWTFPALSSPVTIERLWVFG